MKIKIFLAYIYIFFLTINGTTQEIKKQNISKTAIIKKERISIIEALRANDKLKAKQLRDQLIIQEDSISITLFNQEKILLHFWLNEFEPLKHSIHQPSDYKDTIINWPPYDSLYLALVNKVGKERFDISHEIQINPLLTVEEKDFLLLSLGFFVGERFESQEKINEAANRFLNNYPNSKYSYIVNNNFKQEYYPTKSKFSASIHIGNNILTGDLSKIFRDNFSLGFTFTYYYQRYFLRLNTSLGFTSPRRDIFLNNYLWKRAQSSNMTQFESSLGYVFLPHNRFSFLPFAGIGTTSFAPTFNSIEEEDNYSNIRFKAKFTNYVGLGLRYNIQKQSNKNKFSIYEDKLYSFLKFEYRFSNPFMDRGYSAMGGKAHLVSLTYGWFVQPVTEKKPK